MYTYTYIYIYMCETGNRGLWDWWLLGHLAVSMLSRRCRGAVASIDVKNQTGYEPQRVHITTIPPHTHTSQET